MKPVPLASLVVSSLAALALLLAGCGVVPTYTPPEYQASSVPAPAAPPAYDPAAVPAEPASLPGADGSQLDVIRVGEKLVIMFSDVPAPGLPPHEVSVSSEGIITLPFNQSLKVAGKSKQQVQQEIRAIYVPGYFKQMSVTIRSEERFFTVAGEVRNPSRQLFVGTMTVLKAIAAVGGFTEFANKRRVEVIRSTGEKVTVDAVQAQDNPQRFDLPIYPGDHVHVPRRIL